MIDSELLKYYREKNNLTTRALGRKIKCPRKIIELWEAGELEPSESDLDKLVKLYGITEDDLIKNEQTSYSYVAISIILIVMGLILGVVGKSISEIILLPTSLFITFNIGRIVLNEFKVTRNLDKDIPKSVFGMLLDFEYQEERIKKYYLEANLISASYILFNMIISLLGFSNLTLNIDILKNEEANIVFNMLAIYGILSFIMFAIEYFIGEKMVKNYKGEE